LAVQAIATLLEQLQRFSTVFRSLLIIPLEISAL
jgi:hypothetical protein